MNTVLFDLDGTLLPMNMDDFMDTYFKALESRFETLGFDPEKIKKCLWTGTKAMVANEGYITNEECFWNVFEKYFSNDGKKLERRKRIKIEREMTKFYKSDFQVARFNTRPDSLANECVDLLKSKGYQIVVATNPLYPQVATYERLSWAGFEPDEFLHVTTYENSCFSKPNLNYYRHLLKTLDKDAEDCLMVGNDVDEDMCALEIGMDVFLLNECLINSKKKDISQYKKGNWKVFREYIDTLPNI